MKRGRLRMMEEGLAAQIAEFSVNFSDKGLAAISRSGSSQGSLKTAEQYSKDRECCLQAVLTIPHPKPSNCQYSIMEEELELCVKPIYTVKNLPILLNQFYLDRLKELVQVKHMLLLRWARLAMGQPKVTEEFSMDYQKRIEYLMLEYNDTLNRSRRLSDLCSENVVSAHSVTVADILPFLRWLIYHQHISNKATSFTARIQWFPMRYEQDLGKLIHLIPEKVDTEQHHIKQQHVLTETAKKWFNSQSGPTADKGLDSQLLYPPPSTVAYSLGDCLEGGAGRGDILEGAQIPYHQPDVNKNNSLLHELMINYNIIGPSCFPSAAEELQFYYQVMRKFHSLFSAQESASNFHTYDKLPEGESHAKLNKSKLIFKKSSNWVPFIKVHAIPDPVQIKAFSKMRLAVPDVDPLLSLNSKCTHLHSLQRVVYALKQHSVVVRHPIPFTTLSVTSHKTPHDSLLVWKCIYSGLDSRNPLYTEDVIEIDDQDEREESQDVDVRDLEMDVDMPDALKVILNTGGRDVSSKAKQVNKDAYLGFLLLRHLRIRDLRAKCLRILNFFCSVERTLTIYAEGLSLEHNNDQKKKSSGLLDHSYLFRTPLDYQVDQSDFMRYMEVENHDDFYAFDGDWTVNVWDQRGVAIMYESAMTDLNELEHEMLMVASYYMRKVACRDSGKEFHFKKSEDRDKDELKQLSQDNVDRFGILLDLWSCEASYLHSKMKVVNCYLEAYHHTLNATQRTNLHQSMVTIMQARPRYDVDGFYFTEIYRKEIKCLDAMGELLLGIINHQMSEERAYNQLVCHSDSLDNSKNSSLDPAHLPFGLPLPLLSKYQVSLTGDKHLQVHSYLFEFSESLSVLGNLLQAVKWALDEASILTFAESTKDIVTLHLKLLEVAVSEWMISPDIGTAHASEVYRQLLCGDSIGNPNSMVDIFLTHSNRAEQSIVGGNPVENKLKVTKSWISVLQLISLHHHLFHTCLENEYLTHVYKHQLRTLDYDDCHAHLRCINFDLTLRFPTDKNLDFFITQAREEIKGGNPRLDHYTPTKLKLAVHEVDDKCISAFSFKTKTDILKILSGLGSAGLECVKVCLQAEVTQRNVMVMSCQQNGFIVRSSDKINNRGELSCSHSVGHSSAVSAVSPGSTTPPPRRGPLSRRNALIERKFIVAQDLKAHFISVQREKAPVRDHMLSQFTRQPASIMRSTEDVDKVRCSLISIYCSSINLLFSIHSLRNQSIRSYQSLLRILDEFPATKAAHFIIGESKTVEPVRYNFGTQYVMDPSGKLMAAEVHRSKPHQLLTREGKVVLNLFYIPHFTEILRMFEDLDIQERCDSMKLVQSLAFGLHQFVQYICAYVQLGRALETNADTQDKKEFGAFWGGIESIGSQLLQLQADIGHLSDPCNPKLVAEYLNQRCQVLFYQHDITVRHYLRQSLLVTKNYKALRKLDTVSSSACQQLSATSFNPFFPGHYHNVHYPQYGQLPHPFNTFHPKASSVVPWRAFLFSHGLFPTVLDHSSMIGSYVFISLSCLPPDGLTLAHGEFLGMALVEEDVLLASNLPVSESPLDVSRAEEHQSQLQIPATSSKKPQKPELNPSSRPSSGRLSSGVSYQSSVTDHPYTSQMPPLESCNLVLKFLVTTSQLEQLKSEWGLKVLNCHFVNTRRLAKDLESIYKERVLRQAKKIVAKMQIRDLARKQAEEEMNDLTSEVTLLTEASVDTSGAGADTVEASGAVDELKLREVQVKCLLDMLEQVMVSETSKYLSKLHHLMLNERERDDTVLPLDLWKSNAMNFKDLTGVSRSHVVEDFATRLISQAAIEERATEEGVTMVSVPINALKECLHVLSSGVQAREKECYQLYACYYEALLRSQYNQLYQKNRDIEHYKNLAEVNAEQTREEALCFMGEHTQSLIMEVSALRCKLAQTQEEVTRQVEISHKKAISEYRSLVDELFSASLSIKNKFEDYRGTLYRDMTQSLCEVKQSVAENMQKVKERLGLKDKETDPKGTSVRSSEDKVSPLLKPDAIKAIQDENADLIKSIVKARAVNNWNRHRTGVLHTTELFSLQNKLNSVQLEYLALKINSEEEIISLKQQVQVMQKQLGKVERECEVTKQSLKEEKQKKTTSSKSTAKGHDFLSRTEKTYGAKIDHMTLELEEKQKQLRQLEEEKERVKKLHDFERTQVSKVVQGIKQQLSHERTLKLDAFHQVDSLVQQVQDIDTQAVKVMPNSLYWSSPQSTSSVRIPAPTPNLAVSFKPNLHAASHSRISRPRTQQQQQRPHPRSAQLAERIDLGQEIIALKLI